MSIKNIVREWREMRDGIGSMSRRNRSKTHIAPDQIMPPSEFIEQSPWANLPSELLLDIIQRVEESETSWPGRAAVVFSASVCRSWREITKEIVQTPEQCGRLTFPISLKQPGPRESSIQCFIKRDRATSTYLLYCALVPCEFLFYISMIYKMLLELELSNKMYRFVICDIRQFAAENESDKLLLAARRFRRATCTDFVISLVANDFSRASNTYLGKLRSNFLGTKFAIYDSQPPCGGGSVQQTKHTCQRFNSKQVSPRIPACNYSIGTISYELNVLRTRGPRRMHCIMSSIPVSSIQQEGSAPTPTSFTESLNQHVSPLLVSKATEPVVMVSNSLADHVMPAVASACVPVEPLVLKNKGPRWHEQLQCWCLNFKGRVTVASVKNFQLMADIDQSPSHVHNGTEEEDPEKVILQFGKIGKDMFTMDYCYPMSAFQAFAICLSSFDTKPACE